MKERIQGRDMKQQNQLDKKPSNVRKMILTFETSLVKVFIDKYDHTVLHNLLVNSSFEFAILSKWQKNSHNPP